MSNHAEKANEYAIDVLKLIITISSSSLVLTITFLKEIIGASTPHWTVILFLGWFFLFLSIILSWLSMADAANEFPKDGEIGFIFKSKPEDEEKEKENIPFSTWLFFWRHPQETNLIKKKAASAQFYMLAGLVFIALFAGLNFGNIFAKAQDSKQQTPACIKLKKSTETDDTIEIPKSDDPIKIPDSTNS